ncbi:MAG TPA: hypothetical protein VMT34_09620 [Aggregatilineales bacterium]|nr:hypothetical protein [Aggregatilineales bacterium]
MESFVNGAGALAALAAPLMLAGLVASGAAAAIGSLLRRSAILLAILLPAAFMIAVIVFYHGDPQFDFNVNYRAAAALYLDGSDPYTVHAAYSFPIPTFYLYWLFSRALSPLAAWYAWWIVNAVIWAGCALLLWRSLPPAADPIARAMGLYVCAAIPGITVLWQGQTALLILAGLVAVHYGLRSPGRTNLLIGAAGLAWAALIKPQLVLVGLGIAIWAALRWGATPDRRAEALHAIRLLTGAVAIAVAAVLVTLVLPGGVTLETYRAFLGEALPQVARPSDGLVIGSPAFAAAAIANVLGASDRAADAISTVVTVAMVGAGAFWTWRHRHEAAISIAAGWGVWAMVIPRVAWTWYAAWCLPFFLLTVNGDRRRDALLVIILALLALQPGMMIVAVGTILALIYLLWNGVWAWRPVRM